MSGTLGSSAGGANRYAVTRGDRIPVQRYFDADFYALERERLWSRVWQMGCRREEIPKPGDYSVYEIFDQSVIIVRVDATTVKAYHNACRHRGVQLVVDRGNAPDGVFTCPFHGWQWKTDGKCKFVYSPNLFEKDQLRGGDLALRECRLEIWGGCAFINFDEGAPPLRESIEPFATMHDAWHVETLRTEWWLSARLPVNWKLAMEAFMEGYHVMATHPQLTPPGATPESMMYVPMPRELSPMSPYLTLSTAPMPATVGSKEFIEMNLYFMRLLNQGMAGMTHEKDIRVAESLLETELPGDPAGASKAWRRQLNEAVMAAHKAQGMDIGDLHEVDEKQFATSVNFCFPHYFLLPTFGSASSYRIRPLGPEECLFELWSLTRFPAGQEAPPIKTPTPMGPDDPRWPAIPTQDFANLPRQQRGLHTKGFEYMRLSNQMEGLIGNYHQLIDGYLSGKPSADLVPAAQQVSGCIDRPVVNLGV